MDLMTDVSLRFDPSGIMEMICLIPDPWQRELLPARPIVSCSSALASWESPPASHASPSIKPT